MPGTACFLLPVACCQDSSDPVKAAVYHGQRDIRIETVPGPTPVPTDLALNVGTCGICGTDASEVGVETQAQ